MVPAAGGRLVRLNNVTELSAGKAPGQIDRYNRDLSLRFIYMVLAARFESFVHPITIMLSLLLTLVATPVFYSLFDDLRAPAQAHA